MGSGFIGAEVASTALGAGIEVTVLEAEPVPFARSLGTEVGTWLAARWRDAGVDLRTGCAVGAITGTRESVWLELGDGTGLATDQVLVAIGTRPNDELFHDAFAGIGARGAGIPVDARGRTPVAGIWSAGDVALVAALDGARRVEHWTDAAAAATAVAHDIAGVALPPRTAPYAWSDQFGVRLQVVGRPSGALRTSVARVDDDAFLARYEDAGGRLCGIVAVGHPADVARYRRELAA